MAGRHEVISAATMWPKETGVFVPGTLPFMTRTSVSGDGPTFSFGAKNTPALLTPAALHDYFKLQGAFERLRLGVLSPQGDAADEGLLNGQDAWTVFIAKAVWRMELWARSLPADAKVEEELPPPDVLLAWFVYLLCPRTYFQDGCRHKHALLQVGDFPLAQVAATLDLDTFAFLPPDQIRITRFEERTSQPFALEPPRMNDTAQIKCPFCTNEVEVPWFNSHGATGFAQANFTVQCHCSARPITTKILGLSKFAHDVDSIRHNTKENTLAHCYAGARYGIPTPISKQNTLAVNRNLLREISSFGGDNLEWDITRLKPLLEKAFAGTNFGDPRWVTKTLMAYSYPSPFSVELREAVVRQALTMNYLSEVGWSNPGCFGTDDAILAKMVRQYHMALEIMRAFPEAPFGPTVAIDSAWHTHLLLQQSYRAAVLEFVGVYVEHDNDVSDEVLAPAFTATQATWKKHYGEDYCFEYEPPVRHVDGRLLAEKYASAKAASPEGFSRKRAATKATTDYQATCAFELC